MYESVKFELLMEALLYCRSNCYSPMYHSIDAMTNILFSSGTTGKISLLVPNKPSVCVRVRVGHSLKILARYVLDKVINVLNMDRTFVM